MSFTFFLNFFFASFTEKKLFKFGENPSKNFPHDKWWKILLGVYGYVVFHSMFLIPHIYRTHHRKTGRNQ
jgi:hypothetical protein